MTQFIEFTAIVPASEVETYRQMAAGLHPAGEGMFVTPLYTGPDITHYVSTGLIDTAFAEVVTDPEAFAQAAGVSVAEAQALKDGFTYIGVGTITLGDDDESVPVLHNKGAIEALGLSGVAKDAPDLD